MNIEMTCRNELICRDLLSGGQPASKRMTRHEGNLNHSRVLVKEINNGIAIF